jgi:hypothetical protein
VYISNACQLQQLQLMSGSAVFRVLLYVQLHTAAKIIILLPAAVDYYIIVVLLKLFSSFVTTNNNQALWINMEDNGIY